MCPQPTNEGQTSVLETMTFMPLFVTGGAKPCVSHPMTCAVGRLTPSAPLFGKKGGQGDGNAKRAMRAPRMRRVQYFLILKNNICVSTDKKEAPQRQTFSRGLGISR